MEYRKMGRTGLKVSAFCLGTMMFGRQVEEQESLRIIHQAMDSGVRVLQDFARTLLKHAPGILAWYDYPISTGPLEGTNNKIKTLTRQHYGLRDADFFTLKLYQLHETTYALVG